MKFTFTKSLYEMPDGKYLARFLGVTLRELQPGESPKIGQDGRPMPPAMTWDFEILGGPEGDPDPSNVGKKADKLTGRVPTPKNGCGKMLSAVADAVLKDGVEVDLTHYVGGVYRITVVENRVSDQFAPVRVRDTPVSAARLWDVKDADGNVLRDRTDAQVQDLLKIPEHLKTVVVKPAGGPPGSGKPAGEHGFSLTPSEPAGLKADGTPAKPFDPIPF